ncbi:MAG: DUF4130 domain-containing protein [Thermoplasmata archaeon]|nr:DUF4130 domain-containing protein [Thermoplasmata archaeon]
MSPFPTNFINLLKMHEKCNDSIIRKASGICPDDIDLSTDPEVIKIRKMVNSVLGENHMMKSFVRLKPQGERILYGYMRPRHDVWLRVGSFFARRFPDTVIVLGNNTKSWVGLYNGNTIKHSQAKSLTSTLKELESILGNDTVEDPKELWDTYYWSQYRPEAKNTKYFKQNVRQKYMKAVGLHADTDSGRTTLDQFTE